MTDFAALLPLANEAVDLARREMRSRPFGEISAKGDRDVVSDLDYSIERHVRVFLGERSRSVGFLGEEEGANSSASGDLTWVLDPIDGTANFVRGIPLCAVALALVRDGLPVLGVVDLPFLSSRFSAALGSGAALNGKRVHVAKTNRLHDAIISIGDYAVGEDSEAKNALRLAVTEQLTRRVQRVRMLGSAAIDLAWVGAGTLDATILLSNKPWDTAAGAVVAREAGARVVDRDGADHTLTSRATIAAAPQLIDEVLELVSSAEVLQAGRSASASAERTPLRGPAAT